MPSFKTSSELSSFAERASTKGAGGKTFALEASILLAVVPLLGWSEMPFLDSLAANEPPDFNDSAARESDGRIPAGSSTGCSFASGSVVT